MTDLALKMNRIKIPSAHVRFTEEEYEGLLHDADVSGDSIPKLLKDSYFGRPRLNPLMRHDDQIMLVGQVLRMGNNLNQIAKQLNSGFRAGFNEDFEEIRRMFTLLVTFLTSTYGRTCDRKE